MKLRHKTLNIEVDEQAVGYVPEVNERVIVIDQHGEIRLFKREVLEPVPVQEEWETVNCECGNTIATIIDGRINVLHRSVWITYPHPDLRFHEINGVTVLQRRT